MTRWLGTALKGIGVVLFAVYFLGTTLALSYYNWQYARDHGFVRWVLLGQIVPTAKALVWPYIVFFTWQESGGGAPHGGGSSPPSSVEPRVFKCEQPLPEFTLGRASNPSDAELAKLCACVWSKLPEGGWEREVSAKMRRGEDPGWRGRGFSPRFGAAIDACGGRSL